MAMKREQPEFYTPDPKRLADEIEKETNGHDFDEWNGDLTFFNGEMRLIINALRAAKS